jgi:hypothetical protein
MKRAEVFLEATRKSYELINSYWLKCEARLSPKFFSRERKVGFSDIVMFILSFAKKTLQLELDSFFRIVKDGNMSITKQAFSAARQKISPTVFRTLQNEMVELFYTASDVRTYRGYRLLAIDGTTLEMKNSKELRDAFGFARNNAEPTARARASALYDIENDIIVDAQLTHYDDSEKNLVQKHLERLKSIRKERELILFDRGYPSKELIASLLGDKIEFVMRTTSWFIKEVRDAKGNDTVVDVVSGKKQYKIRVLKIILCTGEEEILITSLLNKDMTVEDFKALYFKRWGIEVKYDELKNKLQLENFTGETPIAVEQDFYASMYLTNMVSFAKMHANEKIAESGEKKVTKHEYKVNVNVLIGKLKDNLIVMMLEESERKRKRIFNQVMQEIIRNRVPVRPGRQRKRSKKFVRDKFPINQKQCL